MTDDIPQLKFNTSIAALMELINTWESNQGVALPLDQISLVIRLVAPFAPFLAEELFQRLTAPQSGQQSSMESVHLQTWPEAAADLAKEEQIVMPVQVDGKLRGTLVVPADQDSTEEAMVAAALELPEITKWVTSNTLKRTVYVPKKVLSLVTK